ncbi:unnamed protein product [Albugo candida]|uniref:Uncharacterized protein n=1 Tax=Albugo candida TaxID=65357 RepID=A0A024GRX4_9STRA|nr:unnamed protein product [Albugo candida]CCI49115.1 unnamed protein product [Albugo candida]|eukprot:CCI46635.1 unnamed protein product [Albugo candida]
MGYSIVDGNEADISVQRKYIHISNFFCIVLQGSKLIIEHYQLFNTCFFRNYNASFIKGDNIAYEKGMKACGIGYKHFLQLSESSCSEEKSGSFIRIDSPFLIDSCYSAFDIRRFSEQLFDMSCH